MQALRKYEALLKPHYVDEFVNAHLSVNLNQFETHMPAPLASGQPVSTAPSPAHAD